MFVLCRHAARLTSIWDSSWRRSSPTRMRPRTTSWPGSTATRTTQTLVSALWLQDHLGLSYPTDISLHERNIGFTFHSQWMKYPSLQMCYVDITWLFMYDLILWTTFKQIGNKEVVMNVQITEHCKLKWNMGAGKLSKVTTCSFCLMAKDVMAYFCSFMMRKENLYFLHATRNELMTLCVFEGYKLGFNYLKARRFVDAIDICHHVSMTKEHTNLFHDAKCLNW